MKRRPRREKGRWGEREGTKIKLLKCDKRVVTFFSEKLQHSKQMGLRTYEMAREKSYPSRLCPCKRFRRNYSLSRAEMLSIDIHPGILSCSRRFRLAIVSASFFPPPFSRVLTENEINKQKYLYQSQLELTERGQKYCDNEGPQKDSSTRHPSSSLSFYIIGFFLVDLSLNQPGNA